MNRLKLSGISANKGFTLVELMISIVLGAIITAGLISVFLSNQQSYRTNQGLSEVQEGTRTAFELMARDIRTAGLTGCVNNNRVANVLNNSSTVWWENWSNPVMGYDNGVTDPAVTTGTSTGNRLAGTDSIALLSAEGTGLSVQIHNLTASPPNFILNETSSDLQSGDVIVVCDPDHATILQITNYSSTPVTLDYNTGTGSPGNCSTGLGFPTNCTTANQYQYGSNAQIGRIAAADWYVGVNAQGGSSLFRTSLVTNPGTVTVSPVSNEMIRNVTNMQITYLETGGSNFVSATSVTNWANVTAVKVNLTLVSENNITTNNTPLTRTVTSTTTIRNRVD